MPARTFDGLPLHRRRQQPVAVAEPFVERFLGAAGAPRHGRHGQRVAALDQQVEHRVEHPPAGAAVGARCHQIRRCLAPVTLGFSDTRTVRYGSAHYPA